MSLGKKIIAVLAAGVMAVSMAACTSSDPVEPNQKVSPTNVAFPFTKGEVEFKTVSEKLGTANLGVKTLHIKTTTVSEVEKAETTAVMEGVIDQTNPEAVAYQLTSTSTSGDEVTKSEVIAIGDEGWVRAEGEEKWTPISDFDIASAVSTSTSLFQSLDEIEGSVTKVVYDGKDNNGHKFVLSLDLNVLSGAPAGSFDPVDFMVWTDDELRVVRQEMLLNSEFGSTKLETIQSKFNDPVTIEKPANIGEALDDSAVVIGGDEDSTVDE